MWYDPSPRPNPYIAILKAMIPTRKTWKQDLRDYGKVAAAGLFIWAMACVIGIMF